MLSEQEDFVADMACHGSHLLCAGGDGTLCVSAPLLGHIFCVPGDNLEKGPLSALSTEIPGGLQYRVSFTSRRDLSVRLFQALSFVHCS